MHTAKKQTLNFVGDVITITYGNGAVFTGDCSTLPEAIYQPCAASRHGIAQKLGDAKSGGTAGEKYAEVQLIWAGLVAGDWNRRGGGEGIEALMPDVFLVLAKAKPEIEDPEAAAAEWLEKYQKLSDEARETLRGKPHIKVAIQKVKADRKLAAGGEGEEEFDPFA